MRWSIDMKKYLLLLLLCNSSDLLAERFDATLSLMMDISSSQEKEKAFLYFYKNTYKPFLAVKKSEKLNKEELKDIVYVFETISYYTHSTQIVEQYLIYFNILQSKHWSEKSDYTSMYGTLVQRRMFTEAKVFYTKYAQFGLSNLPQILKDNQINEGVTFYTSHNEKKNTLIEKKYIFPKGKSIIIIAHPLCHFCQRAVAEIAKNKRLSQILAKRSFGIVPVDRNFNSELLYNWNKKHPNFQLNYIQNSNDFPMLDFWGTPTFYFLDNNKVIDKLVGWPKEGRIQELKVLIQKHFKLQIEK